MASAAVTSVDTGTAPDATSARATQAAASVVPPGSGPAAPRRRPPPRRPGATPWKSSSRPCGAVPVKCSSWTPSSGPTVGDQAGLLAHLACDRRGRSSPWSTPPPGSVHAPGAGPGRVPGEQDGVVAHDQGVRRQPLDARPVDGRASASRTIGTVGIDARLDVLDRQPPRVDRRPVDLDDPRLGRVGGHPGVVHDPHGVHVGRLRSRSTTRCAEPIQRAPEPAVETGLLVDLAHHGVVRVLAEVDAATGQGPQLVLGDRGREAGQQDVAAAHDHGVRRDPLPAWQPTRIPETCRTWWGV